MIRLKPLSSYTASEISEAVGFSPALKTYLGLTYSSDSSLHQKRNTAWIECALGTLLNTHTSKEVCTFWSEVSYQILKECFDQNFPAAKAALFALGKMGSHELNLSSDVDILMISDEESSAHLKGLRQFQKALSERTRYGFVFRVDFDLRPGGRQGPLIPTVDQFVDYYGNYGETWERLAFVRLNAVAGNTDVISQTLGFAKKFTYRKHLDYTLLDDLKALRGRIRQHYAPDSGEKVWDLKLGVGGIRDVELFVHALQVVHGGKNSSLQVHGTEQALRLLQEQAILPSADCEFLIRHYWSLRQLENMAQSFNDEQTHLLEKNSAVPPWAAAQLKTLDQDLRHCDHIVSSLLGKAEDAEKARAPEITATSQEIWKEILEIEVHSRNKDRDEEARLRFLNEFYQTLLQQKGDTEKALQHLKDFIKSTRAKASFFTLLLRNKNLLDELAWLFGHSPYLSQILSTRPELIDSYVYRSQELAKDDLSLLLEQLVEKRLLGEIINGSLFLEDKNVLALQANLSATADQICSHLLGQLKTEFPSEMEILCLGKWGGKELGFRSDLDFILVTPHEPNEVDGKLARRLINRLTELRKGGNIYPIDMRLKPSGKAGPMVISYADLCAYLSTQAEAWERQAYLKSRWLDPATKFQDLKPRLLEKPLTAEQLQTLEKIRHELVRHQPGTWDLKYMEAGLLDIELFSQTVLLDQQKLPPGSSTLEFLAALPQTKDLQESYVQMRQIEQMAQLVSTEGGAKLVTNHESFQRLAKALQETPDQLENRLKSLSNDSLVALQKLDPRRGTKILSFSSN